jgi:cupin fold WbuC family metalloprotein
VDLVQIIDEDLFNQTAARARNAPRKRMNHNFHAGAADNPHRFLNVLLRGTYIRPHRHLQPPKSESFLVLEGVADVLLFSEDGSVIARYRLGENVNGGRRWGLDLVPGVWHTMVAISERVVCYEVKPGPWEPASDKEFAEWAPKEGEMGAQEFLEQLMSC